MTDVLNSWITGMTGAIFAAFGPAPSMLPLIAVAMAFGIAVAISFRYTTPQRRLRHVADLARAELLAIKLFRHDPIVVLKAFGRLLVYSALRVAYAAPSLIVMLPLSILLLVQLASWYELRPLHVGDTAVVEVQVSDSSLRDFAAVEMHPPINISIETSPVRDHQSHTVSWRIRANGLGSNPLRFQIANATAEKSIDVADVTEDFRAVSSRRAGRGWWDRVMNPAEASFSEQASLLSAEVDYPIREIPFWGWRLPWWMLFFSAAFLTALAAKPFVGVQY
jgi:hypothetical protein